MTTMASANAGNDGAVTPVTSPLQRTTSEDILVPKQLQNTKIADKFGGSTESISFKKSLVLDEDRFEQTFLRCRICKERFTSEDKAPKILPCHHSFCVSCVINLFLKEARYRQSLTPAILDLPSAVTIVCPTCRANFISTQDGLKHLPIDHRIVQLIDFIRTTDRYTVHYCNSHSGQPLNFFCENCVVPVCRTCTVASHIEGEGHSVMDIEDALQKYTPLVDTALAEMEAELKDLDENSGVVDTTASALDKVRDELLNQIHEAFGRLRKVLNEREKEMVDISNREVHSQKHRLARRVEIIKGRREALREHSKALRMAKEEGKVEDLFRAHQNSQDIRATTIDEQLAEKDEDEGPVTTFSFRGDEEKSIQTKIQNFGDILSSIEEELPRLNISNSYSSRYGN